MVYNYSNSTGIKGITHHGSKVIVEVPDGCMIIFTSISFHTIVRSCDRISGTSFPHIRGFAYIVEQYYLSMRNYVSKMLGK